MKKKTYKTPAFKEINISATEILADSCNINTGSSLLFENYEYIDGYDKEQDGWEIGSPD